MYVGMYVCVPLRRLATSLPLFLPTHQPTIQVIVNTTTLGNCAIYPTTVMGRILSCIVAYCGILSIALPISIVGKNFTEQYNLVYGKMVGPWGMIEAKSPSPAMSRQNSSK